MFILVNFVLPVAGLVLLWLVRRWVMTRYTQDRPGPVWNTSRQDEIDQLKQDWGK